MSDSERAALPREASASLHVTQLGRGEKLLLVLATPLVPSLAIACFNLHDTENLKDYSSLARSHDRVHRSLSTYTY